MKKIIITAIAICFLITLTACASIINELPKTNVAYLDEDDIIERGFSDSVRDWVDRNEIDGLQTIGNQSELNKVVIKTDFGMVSVDVNPRRILTLFNEATETAVALGFSPIGYVDSIESQDKDVWYDLMLEKGMNPNLPVLGNQEYLDIEAIKALQPDLIFASYDIHGKYFEELSAIAPTIFTDNSISAFNENFLLFAEALGKRDEAEMMLIDYYIFTEEIYSKYSMYKQKYVTVLQIEGDRVYTLLESTFSVEVLKSIGFNFFTVLTGETERIESNINTINGDIFFVSVSKDKSQAGHNLLEEFVELEEELERDAIILEVPYGVWDSTNGYLSAKEILEEVDSILSDKVITSNKYQIRRIR